MNMLGFRKKETGKTFPSQEAYKLPKRRTSEIGKPAWNGRTDILPTPPATPSTPSQDKKRKDQISL